MTADPDVKTDGAANTDGNVWLRQQLQPVRQRDRLEEDLKSAATQANESLKTLSDHLDALATALGPAVAAPAQRILTGLVLGPHADLETLAWRAARRAQRLEATVALQARAYDERLARQLSTMLRATRWCGN